MKGEKEPTAAHKQANGFPAASEQGQPRQGKEAEKELVFELGLVMAGAVSAGAYTAGVIDYLIEALEAWEKAREAEKDFLPEQRTIPYHKVRIKVISGASAGGMTGAMLAAMIRKKATGSAVPGMIKSMWVEEIDIEHLLQDTDFKKGKKGIRSILNSSEIVAIANRAFDFSPAKTAWKPISYIDDQLKLYLTLSNLRGIPYEFNISGETGFKYGMANYADYEEATINADTSPGKWNSIKQAAVATGAFPLGLSARLIQRDPNEYFLRSEREGKAYISLKFKREGTYVFTCVDGGVLNNEPLKLAFDELYRNSPQREMVLRLSNSFSQEKGTTASPLVQGSADSSMNKEAAAAQEAVLATDSVSSFSDTLELVDVHQEQVFNAIREPVREEPLKRAMAGGKEKADQDLYAKTLDRALILVDPFPNIIEVSQENDQEDSLNIFRLVPRIIAALRRQVSFKPDDLLAAAHQRIYSSFMISPIRHNAAGEKQEYSLASGFLGGFGGFFLKEFREHDYQLGRRNCQRFLEKYFVVPADEFQSNPLFGGANGKLLAKYKVTPEGGGKDYYPILPLMGDKQHEEVNYTFTACSGEQISVQNMRRVEKQTTWPGYRPEIFADLIKKVSRRSDLIIDRLVKETKYGWLVNASFLIGGLLLGLAAAVYFIFLRAAVPGSGLYTLLFAIVLFAAGIPCTIAGVYLLFKRKVVHKIKLILQEQLERYGLFGSNQGL